MLAIIKVASHVFSKTTSGPSPDEDNKGAFAADNQAGALGMHLVCKPVMNGAKQKSWFDSKPI